jgi:hypothetical protein
VYDGVRVNFMEPVHRHMRSKGSDEHHRELNEKRKSRKSNARRPCSRCGYKGDRAHRGDGTEKIRAKKIV